ncbi:retropepsin-like aspartic protease [Mucilaginibacter sp. 44-25]|uniref:retropepsin-like aspartic protease n=1 Tax=Mucilaginibacter sp. 44-25 TaxID=1895794 RepID=UPI0009675030|nr:retropepsin-like aspartic protease [Mucilaginibacter sp. 44-25]OJW13908.1 MAG: hypothetical protein BGO48_04115 [Mucilaginibacter sp. 44-25]
MKISLILIISLLYLRSSRAQSQTLNLGGAAPKGYYAEMPYEFIGGKIIIKAELGGKLRRFLLDTGAPVAISKELSAELKADLIYNNMIRDVNGVADSAAVVRLGHIRLGNIDFVDIPAVVVESDFYKCFDIEGVIGSNLFRNSIITIAGDRRQIIITDQPDKLKLNPKSSVPMITTGKNNQQSNPFIKVTLKYGVGMLLGFDTGDSDFLRFTDDYMMQLQNKGVYDIVSKGYGANSVGLFGLQAVADKYLLKLSAITIGTARFNNVITETNKGGLPAMGTKLLEYGNVTLDFIKGKFYFDAHKPVHDLNRKIWPFQPVVSDGKLVVGLIWDKSGNSVKPGEQITEIDGQAYPSVSLCEMITSKQPLLAGKESAVIQLKDQQGKSRKLLITKN